MKKEVRRKRKVSGFCLLLIGLFVALPAFSMEDYCNEYDTYELPEVEVSWERDDNSRDDDREWWERDHDTNTDDDLNDNQTDEDITRDDGDSSSDKDGKDTGKDITTIFIKSELTVKEMQDLLNKVSSLMSISPYFAQLFNYLINNYVLVANIGINPGISSPAHFNSETNALFFKNSDAITNEKVLLEEFFHIYQHNYYDGIDKYSEKGHSNIEFEAKLFFDIINNGLLGLDCCLAITNNLYDTEYTNWIQNITNEGNNFPTWEVMEEKYYYYLEIFIKTNPAYNFPIDYDLKPDGMLNFK